MTRLVSRALMAAAALAAGARLLMVAAAVAPVVALSSGCSEQVQLVDAPKIDIPPASPPKVTSKRGQGPPPGTSAGMTGPPGSAPR